jgi:hypothetical protein
MSEKMGVPPYILKFRGFFLARREELNAGKKRGSDS